jgi:Surfeit locus protein 6
MPPKKQDLLWELTEHNHFFDMIAEMLPHTKTSNQTASNDGATSTESKKGKFHKDPGPESKEGRRAAAKVAKAAAKAAKRRRLNGDSQAEDGDGHSPGERLNEIGLGVSHRSPANDGGDHENSVPSADADLPPEQSRIEALRAKLQAKLAALQKGDRPSPELVSKRAARRAEKRRRQQEHQQKQQKSATTGAANALPTYKLPSGTAADGSTPDLDIAATIGFGRLTGIQPPRAGGGGSQNYMEVNKALANLSKTKNLHKMLADAEAKKAKLDALKQSSDASDLKQAAKIQWSDAMQEAAGNRVKDDPSKIKKVLKKKVAKKKKSEKAWKSRMEQVQQAKDERQKNRTQNLQARKHKGRGAVGGATVTSKEDRSKGPPPGRRLSRPGFEGRKQEFLNGGGSNKK